MKKGFYAVIVLIMMVIGGVIYLYFTNDGVYNEFHQLRQPRPNTFIVGIDVSADIDHEMLNVLKKNLIERLEYFIGDKSVSYQIYSFGRPGCGMQAISQLISTVSPQDKTSFDLEVAKKIQALSVTVNDPNDMRPVTTPLYCLLDYIVKREQGTRIIIFSDLINNDGDCRRAYFFPDDALRQYGKDKSGQIMFLYSNPPLSEHNVEYNQRVLARQKSFMDEVQVLRNQGDLRAYFYHIPDEPEQRAKYIESRLKQAIPVTEFEIVMEKVSKVMNTIVSAVRG